MQENEKQAPRSTAATPDREQLSAEAEPMNSHIFNPAPFSPQFDHGV